MALGLRRLHHTAVRVELIRLADEPLAADPVAPIMSA